MPKCTVCIHPDRDAIDRDLVAGKSLRYVANRRGTSRSALFRHKRDHIPADLAHNARIHVSAHRAELSAQAAEQDARNLGRAETLAAQVDAQEAAAHTRALDILSELELTFRRVTRLFDACDRWLTDPDHPDRYDLGPRAEEVLVRYTAPDKSGQLIHAKARLSELLARAAGGQASGDSLVVDGVDLKTSDPRELILKAARRLEAELQLVARLLGQLQEAQPTVNVLVTSPEWIAIRTAILTALEPYPDARAAVAEAIKHAATGH